MTDTRKVQLASEFDASGVRKGTQEAKDAVRDMARDVQASGQQAAQGLDGIGKGADAAAQKTERATKSIAASIERATAAARAGEKGTAAYFEALAAQRGANLATLQPYIDQLRQVERAQQAAAGSLGAMGVSAGQTRAALRQLPAQFTDIFTSLASGQAPLTVLIQQGGQIKDSFGGVREALSGIGAAINPTVVGLAVAGGAIAALAVAYKQGAAEAEAYRRALVLSGNAVGTTAAALADSAARVAQSVGTQAQAAAVLAQLAGGGRVAAADLELVTEAAVRLQREGGPAIKDTVAAFAELGKDPTAGALKLNESTRFLTVELIDQIRTLQEQGKTFEAARVAQQAYAREAIDRAKELEQGLGTLGRAWRDVAEGAKSAWDYMLGIGRAQTPVQRLAEIQEQLALLDQSRQDRFLLFGPSRQDLRTESGAINRGLLNAAERSAAQREAALAAEDAEKARKAWEKWGDEATSTADKISAAVAKMRADMAAENQRRERLGQPLISEQDARRAEAAIRAQYDKTKALTSAQLEQQMVLQASRDAAKEWADAITDFQAIQAKATASTDGLNEAQKRVVQLLTSQGWKQASEPARQLAIQSFIAANNALEHAAAEKQRAQALQQSEASYKRYLADLDRGVESAKRQVEQLQDEYIELTQGKAARDRAVQQRLDDAAAMARQVANGALLTEGLTAETQKLIALADAQQAVADGRRRNTQQAGVNQVVDAARRESERWMADLQSGLTNVFRQAFLAGGNFGKNFARGLAAEVQAQLATALAQLLTGQLLSALVGTVAGAAASGSSGAAGSWLQGASSLQSAYNLYSGGGLYGQAGRAALNTQMGSTIWYGSGAGLAQGGGAAAGIGGTSAGAIMGDAGSTVAANAVGSGSLGASSVSWVPYVGWAIAALTVSLEAWKKGFSNENLNNKFIDSGAAGTLGLGGPIYVSRALDSLGIGSSKWNQIFSGAAGLNFLFGRGAPEITAQGITGTVGGGDFTGQAFADIRQKGGLFRSDKNSTELAALPEDIEKFLDAAAAAVLSQAKDYGKALGLPAEQLAGVSKEIRVVLTDDAEANLKALQDSLSGYGEALVGSWADAIKPLVTYGETSAQTIARVSTAILGVNDVLKTLGLTALQASIDGGAAAVALQELFGGLDTLRSAAGNYLQNYYSDEERKALALRGIGDVLGEFGLTVPATRDAFRGLVEAQDLTTESGRQAFAALMGVAEAFAAVVPAAEDAGAALAAAAKAIADERYSLETQLLQAQGNTAELRRRELEKIDPSNRDLLQQIWGIEDAKAAAAAAQKEAEAAIARARDAAAASEAYWRAQEEAAARVQAAWNEAWKSIEDEINRLRGGVVGNKGQAYASAQAQFAVTLASAQAGSVESARELPGLSKLLDELMTERATSAVEVALSRARLIASLQTVPRYAGGGYHPGGMRLVGERSPELEVTGPSRIYNPQQLGQAMGVDELRQEIRALRADMLQAQATIAGYTQRSAQALERALPDGDAFAVRVTP